jgi:hypothetical protein
MRCNQCPRPAIYQVSDQRIPLCLDCYHKFQTINHMQFLQNAAMMNQALDDMDEISGIASGGGRIPVAEMAKAMQKKAPVYNNIRIHNSTVGVLNTGDLARIDAVITLTKDTDVEAVGDKLRALTQAVIDSAELAAESRKEIVDLLQSLSEQVIGSQSQRKPSVIFALMKAIEERAKGVAAISQAATLLGEAIRQIFGP